MSTYNPDFYKTTHRISSKDAREIVPILLNKLSAKSVIDVGCGTGAWLNAFVDAGLDDICGIEGEWAPTDFLRFSPDNIIRADLVDPPTAHRKFDLVVSIEVAEHLPESSADNFVELLADLGDQIVFSAAIPGQGGNAHVNEQWPDYWHEKFAKHGFAICDIRQDFWENKNIDPCIRQNLFILLRHPSGKTPAGYKSPPRMVHPELYSFALEKLGWTSVLQQHMTLRKAVKMMPSLFWNSVLHRLRGDN